MSTFGCQRDLKHESGRIHSFGAPEVVAVEEVPRLAPAAGELLIRVPASGVGPWDALIREGKSKVSPLPPLTLGSDLSGVVEEAGPDVSEFKKGDEIYGVTNPQFCGQRTICCRPGQHGGFEAYAQAGYFANTPFRCRKSLDNGDPLSLLRMSAPGHSAIRLSAQAKRKNTRARLG